MTLASSTATITATTSAQEDKTPDRHIICDGFSSTKSVSTKRVFRATLRGSSTGTQTHRTGARSSTLKNCKKPTVFNSFCHAAPSIQKHSESKQSPEQNALTKQAQKNTRFCAFSRLGCKRVWTAEYARSALQDPAA